MRALLTEKRLATMKPPTAGRLEIFDTVKTGLAFRLTANGAASWSLMYRLDGRQARHTIGPYPRIGLAVARQMASDALELVGRGIDPRAAKAAAKTTDASRRADTVSRIGEDFIARHVSKKRWPEYERLMRREIMLPWHDRPISEITRRDVIDLLDTIAKRAPVGANRVLTVMSVFFGWAMDRDVIEADPTARVRKPTEETSRDRVLDDAELRAFWIGCDRLGWPFGPIFKLLAITAARKSEIGDVQWPEISKPKRLIEIPGDRYKTGRPMVIPLPASAMAIVEQLPVIEPQKLDDGTMAPAYVFTTTGKTAVSGFSKAKAELDGYMLEELRRAAAEPEKITLPPWIVHDLRRTARTNFSG
jgi:integrase